MDPKDILQSGLLELYALGSLEGSELEMVEQALEQDAALAKELGLIEDTLLALAQAQAIDPPLTAKPILMAKIDYMERLQAGEQPEEVPGLGPESTLQDFERWLNRADMVAPDDFGAIHIKIIGFDAEKVTTITWLRYGAPDETHTDEHERFLIVEGTCDITVGTEVNSLQAGDFFQIPLHINHNVRVTSAIPCKIILQRAAA